jgi:hypothetical protein
MHSLPNKSLLFILFENIIIYLLQMNTQKYSLAILCILVVVCVLAYGGWMFFAKPQDEQKDNTQKVAPVTASNTNTQISPQKAEEKTAATDVDNGKKRYINETYSFTIEIPNDWVVDETGSICGTDFAKTNTIGFRSNTKQAMLEKEQRDYEQGKSAFGPCYESSPNELTIQWYATAQELPLNDKNSTVAEWVRTQKEQSAQVQLPASTIQKVGPYTAYSYFSSSIDAADENVVVDTEKGIFILSDDNQNEDEKAVVEHAIIQSFRVQ